MDVAEYLDDLPQNPEKLNLVDDRRLACVTEKEVVTEHAQWRYP